MHDDHIVIDYLLKELHDHGPSQFDVSKELEVRFGMDFANRLSVFYARSLEYYDLAKKNQDGGFFNLTDKGQKAIKNGGWLAFKRLDEIAIEEEFRRELASRKREAEREAEHEKKSFQKTQNMSAIALILAVAAFVLSLANYLTD